MAIGHEQPTILQSQQMRRQPPHADRVRLRPGFAAVGRFTLQRFARIGLIVVTNMQHDPAIGRFDRVQFIRPPDRGAREAILSVLLRDRPVDGRIDTRVLAQATSGFSGADLRHLVDTAVEAAIAASIEKGQEIPLTEGLLRQVMGEVKPTTLEWLTTARNYARYSNEGGQYDEVLAFLAEHGKS